MTNAIEHFSRHRVDSTTLQVMADAQHDLARLVDEEQAVIRQYAHAGRWPHRRVNLFVLEDLKPLVSQIKNVSAMSSVVADDIDRRPMVNVYDAADLTECAVFVNRSALDEDGVWRDGVALRALLAHEHGHPLAENATVHAARALSVEVAVGNGAATRGVAQVLHLLAERLCLHAPQEVFANETAIRAGFGDALFHLDSGVVEKARLGVAARPALVRRLDKQAKDGELTAERAAALLLVGDLQAHLPLALETAPFFRAGHLQQGEALEAALFRGVLTHLDVAAMRLYEEFRDHYLRLREDLVPAEMRTWAADALGFLAHALEASNLPVQFELAQPGSAKTKRRQSRPGRAAAFNHDGRLP